MTVMSRLRAAIAVSHEQIEKTPYSVAIMRGSIGISDYVVSLAQLHAIHQTLESIASTSEYAEYFVDEMIRTPAIKRDIRFWGSNLADVAVMPETLKTCEQIKQAANECPAAILSTIYVLEGSRMGSLVIVKPLAAALQVVPSDGQGLDYHTEGARQTPQRLAAWKARVEQIGLTDSEIESMENAAKDFMGSLTDLYAKLPASQTMLFDRSQSDVA